MLGVNLELIPSKTIIYATKKLHVEIYNLRDCFFFLLSVEKGRVGGSAILKSGSIQYREYSRRPLLANTRHSPKCC